MNGGRQSVRKLKARWDTQADEKEEEVRGRGWCVRVSVSLKWPNLKWELLPGNIYQVLRDFFNPGNSLVSPISLTFANKFAIHH